MKILKLLPCHVDLSCSGYSFAILTRKLYFSGTNNILSEKQLSNCIADVLHIFYPVFSGTHRNPPYIYIYIVKSTFWLNLQISFGKLFVFLSLKSCTPYMVGFSTGSHRKIICPQKKYMSL